MLLGPRDDVPDLPLFPSIPQGGGKRSLPGVGFFFCFLSPPPWWLLVDRGIFSFNKIFCCF